MVAEAALQQSLRNERTAPITRTDHPAPTPTVVAPSEGRQAPALLLSGPAVVRTPPGLPPPTISVAGPSPWWPNPRKERTLVINDHDFDLESASVSGEWAKGKIDGPLNYNGTYTISANRGASSAGPATLRMAMHIAGDNFVDVDLRITISVRESRGGPRVSLRFENELAPAGDPNRVLVRDVPLIVDGTGCACEVTVPKTDNPQESQVVAIRWNND